MSKDLYKPLWQSILIGVILIVGGVLAFNNPVSAVATLALLLGILVLVRGGLMIVEFFQLRKRGLLTWQDWITLVMGILLVVLAIDLLINPNISIFLIGKLAAIGFISDAIHSIFIAHWIRPFSFGLWLSITILNIFLLITGFVMLFDWITASHVVAYMIAIDLLVSGVGNILVGFFHKREEETV